MRCTHRITLAGQSAYLTRSQILITERLVRWARDAALYKCFGSLVLVTEMLRCSQCQEFCETWVATFPRAADSYYDFVEALKDELDEEDRLKYSGRHGWSGNVGPCLEL